MNNNIYANYDNNQFGSINMSGILRELDKVREKLKKGTAATLLMQKPFASGMYRFSMFIIDYYSRVREKLKIDYDSFMIIQTAVSHNLYTLSREKIGGTSYEELEKEWEGLLKQQDKILGSMSVGIKNNNKLTFSSICLVTKLPKETVRRKIYKLSKRNLLKISKKDGITLGPEYKRVFRDFVPTTTLEVAKLMKSWEKSGILKSLLNFRT